MNEIGIVRYLDDIVLSTEAAKQAIAVALSEKIQFFWKGNVGSNIKPESQPTHCPIPPPVPVVGRMKGREFIEDAACFGGLEIAHQQALITFTISIVAQVRYEKGTNFM